MHPEMQKRNTTERLFRDKAHRLLNRQKYDRDIGKGIMVPYNKHGTGPVHLTELRLVFDGQVHPQAPHAKS